MRDVYVEKFSRMIDETSNQTGYYPSEYIRTYMACLLAEYIDDRDFFSQPIATRYLQLNHRSARDAKRIGDDCLIIVGMFPKFKSRILESRRYFSSLGSGSYSIAADATGSEIFETLSEDFQDLTEFLNRVQPPTFL